MKYLGIDYGAKRVGLATSDESGTVAFPHSIIANTDQLAHHLAKFVEDHDIDTVVVGHSVDQHGEENEIMARAYELIGQLSMVTSVPIELERETFTSAEARRRPGFDGFDRRRPADQRRRPSVDTGAIDDRAAALILQRYLDRKDK